MWGVWLIQSVYYVMLLSFSWCGKSLCFTGSPCTLLWWCIRIRYFTFGTLPILCNSWEGLVVAGMRLNNKQELPWPNGTQRRPDISCFPIHSSSVSFDWLCYGSQRILAVGIVCLFFVLYSMNMEMKMILGCRTRIRSSMSIGRLHGYYPHSSI